MKTADNASLRQNILTTPLVSDIILLLNRNKPGAWKQLIIIPAQNDGEIIKYTTTI